MTAWLLLGVLSGEPSVVAVRTETVRSRPAVKVVIDGTPTAVEVRREGSDVVVRVGGARAALQVVPLVTAPIGAIRIEREARGTTLRVRVPPGTAYEIDREPGAIIVVFSMAAPPIAPAATQPVAQAVTPPVVQATTQPAAQAPAQPVTQPAARPTPPVSQPATPPILQPVTPQPTQSAPPPPSSPTPSPAPSSDVVELYRSVFPAPIEGTPDGALETNETADVTDQSDHTTTGLQVGRVIVRPSIRSTYVDGELTLESATPVRDRYYQVVPRVGLEAPLALGQLTAGYEARIQKGSSFDLVETTTHVADATLELPLGERITLQSSAHYYRGVMETTELDPGREYFFRLGRFTRKEAMAAARIDLGGRLDLRLQGILNRVDVSGDAGFFDYETQTASAALRTEVGVRFGLSLQYSLDRVPAPAERPVAESTGHSIDAVLDGEILPLVTGRVSVGYSVRENPRAEEAGRRYSGLVFSAGLTKEFTRATSLRLSGNRSTMLSAFEQNGFYVSTSGQAELTLGLPYSLSGRAGAGYHWNQYRIAASAIGVPREDRIVGWSLGLGRPLTSWSYVRVDYRRERRESNVTEFDSRSHVLTVQLGLGVFQATSP